MVNGLNLGSLPLGEHDADWFRVMSAASNSSLRVKAASVIGYFVRRRKTEYVGIVAYLARKHGLSFDECFHRLRNDEELPPALDYFEVDPHIEAEIQSSED